ncbi:MAG: GH25 family lysozyme [Lachnospira sp.]|nr:GH25 family lysozyme [Lachnospira sp.]
MERIEKMRYWRGIKAAFLSGVIFLLFLILDFPITVSAGDCAWQTIDGRKYLIDSEGNCLSKTGIDVSKWQGKIEWDKVAEDDIHFAIIRIGHGHDENWKDTNAEENMKACERLGIPYGVYFYSSAVTNEEAKEEASKLLAAIKGYNPSIGVYIDIEDTAAYQNAGIDPYKDGSKIVKFADIMLSEIIQAGYMPGIYANTDYFDNVIYPASHFYSEIRWVARYYDYNTDHKDSNQAPSGNWDIWQYGSTGTVKGIDGNVDLDAMICESYRTDYNRISKPGWVNVDGWRYKKTDGTFCTGWQYIDGNWYWFDDSGCRQTGWLKQETEVYYLKNDGRMAVGWHQLSDGGWYFFYGSGVMARDGWKKIGECWYYFADDGCMQTGWVSSDGNRYYLDDDGVMATGWRQIDNVWYFFEPNGVMAHDRWERSADVWYYFLSDGSMAAGWQSIHGSWFYLNHNGSMAYDEYRDGYWLNADGRWTYLPRASWRFSDGRWWYGDDAGWYAANEDLWIDGVPYPFNSEGYLK